MRNRKRAGKRKKQTKETPGISPAEARAFRKRWAAVNRAEIEELRRTTPEEKFRQLCALMESAKALGWDEALAAEETEVRKRWMRLRKAYGAS